MFALILHRVTRDICMQLSGPQSNREISVDTVVAVWLLVCWFQKSVMVYEIYDDGAIAKDDRLLCGDQILEVSLFSDFV